MSRLDPTPSETVSDEQSLSPRVWLITGCSSGFGRAIAEAALGRGDTVVATARRPDTPGDLADSVPVGSILALPLDVTERGQIRGVVEEVVARASVG